MDEDINNENNYDFFDFLIRILMSLFLIYIFTGLVASYPFLILETSKKYKNTNFYWILNLVLLVSVLIKNLINILLIQYFSKKILLLWYILLYLLGAIIFVLYLYNYREIFIKDKEEKGPFYEFGKLIFKSELITIQVKIQNYKQLFLSTFNKRIILLIFINLSTRASKLKYKTEYKDFFKHALFLLLNFFLSYLIYYFMDYKKNENSYSKEKYLISIIKIENIIIFILSIISFIFAFISSYHFFIIVR